MLESLTNIQLLILLASGVSAILVLAAWCFRRYVLQVLQPSKNILWLIAFQVLMITGIAFLVDNGCTYLSIYEYVFRSGQSYCTLPRYYWNGISFLGLLSIISIFVWIAKSPLGGGVGRVKHMKIIFDD